MADSQLQVKTTDATTGSPSGTANIKLVDIGSSLYGFAVGVRNSDGSAVGGGYRSTPTVTRPANTTAYTAGDVLGGAIEFTNIGPTAGYVMLTSFDLQAYISAVPAGMTNFTLHLYDVTPPSALADNAAWDLPSGDRASYLGYIDLPPMTDRGSTCHAQVNQVLQQYKLAAASTSLFGYLVTNGGFTPAANSEVYMPRLRAIGV